MPQINDAANLSIHLARDGVSVEATNTPSEVDSVHFPGLYKIVLTASEMNCDSISVGGTSITSNVIVIPVLLMTESGEIAIIKSSQIDEENDIEVIKGLIGYGEGLVNWTYSLTDEITGRPIPDCKVEVSTDAAHENIVRLGYTNDFGEVTFMLVPGAMYYIWRIKAGYRFDNPDVEAV